MRPSPSWVHPAPLITIDNAGSLFFHIDLFDVFGHQVLSLQEVGREINVDVSGVATGMYLLHVKSNKGVYALKVMIE